MRCSGLAPKVWTSASSLPTFPLGPGDLGTTPTGKVVLDFLNGKMPGSQIPP